MSRLASTVIDKNTMLRYHILPPSLGVEMRSYVEDRLQPGDFLTAVLENDLVGAFRTADSNNIHNMIAIAWFLHNELPARSYCLVWGSQRVVQDWLNRGEHSEGICGDCCPLCEKEKQVL